MSSDVDTSDSPPLESIEWDELTGGRTVSWRLVGFVLSLCILGFFYWYAEARNVGLIYPWGASTLTWVFRVCLLIAVFFGLAPLVRNWDRTRYYWRRFRSDPIAVACLGYLVVFVLLAVFGPMVLGRPHVNPRYGYQPPVYFTAPEGTVAQNCAGPVIGSEISQVCVGTWRFPLGTTAVGQDMIMLLIAGMHVSLQVALIAAVLMIPVATAVGITAGYVGGIVDDVLMRYVDVQQSVPALVVYIVLVFVFGPSLLLLITVFGLLNWGSTARLVRSEVIQRREELYIDAATASGVGKLTTLRRHVLPNVSNTVIVETTQKIPQLVLLETALTFMNLGDRGRLLQSFGGTIASGFDGAYGNPPFDVWWIWVLPVVVLALTVIAFSVVGDVLRDVLDPRGEMS